MSGDTILSNSQPNAFFVPKNKVERRQWFMDNIKWIMSYYDRKNYFRGEEEASVDYPVDRIEKYFRYYLGRQERPAAYRHTFVTKNNKPLRTIYIKGQKVGTLVDFLDGTGKLMIENLKITVKTTSKEAQNKRTELLEQVRTEMLLKADFQDFEQFGVSYKPIGNKSQEFYNVEEAERWMDKDYQEEAAIWGQKIGDDIFHRNHLGEQLPAELLMVWIAGICACHVYAYNGRTVIDTIDPRMLIWDNSNGFDSFNRKARFAGFVEYLDSSDVLSRWEKQLSAVEREEIRSATPNTIAEVFPMIGRVSGYNSQNNNYKLSKVTVYWKGRRNLPWKDGDENQWGHKPFYKSEEGEGDYYDQCVYQGTLIANKYLVDCGVAPNQVKDPYNPGDSELPIKVFVPNLVLGETNSVVSKLHQLQDLVDYYTNEIKKMVGRNLGRAHVFYSEMFDGPNSPAEMFSDIESTGITYINRKKGEPGDSRAHDRVSEAIDMTFDPNIQHLANLRAEQERIMESIVNLSQIAMGQQQGYVSQGAQQKSISQNNISTVATMKGFCTYVEMVMQHAVNVGRIIHSLEDDNIIPIAGRRGKAFLKETTEFSNEELGVYIKVLDIIDEQGKMRLQQIALGLAQNNLLSFIDWIEVEKATTYTEILQYMEMVFKRKERDVKEQQAMALAAQEIEAAKQEQIQRIASETKLAATQMQVEGKSADTQLKVEADLAKTGFQAGQQTQVA